MQKTIASNETATKEILHQRKFKKYSNCKYKPKTAIKAENITDKSKNLTKAIYAEILRVNKTPTKRLSKTNNTDHNIKPNIQEKLLSLTQVNRYRGQGKSLSRKFSNSSIKNNDNYERKINFVQEEIKN